jgi:cyclopropane fatty-acyl-phospholipid synthase-like methyltransferase
MRVLDVAAGDGNTALAAARRGATVIAVDITPAQVRRVAFARRPRVPWCGGRKETRIASRSEM